MKRDVKVKSELSPSLKGRSVLGWRGVGLFGELVSGRHMQFAGRELDEREKGSRRRKDKRWEDGSSACGRSSSFAKRRG